MAIGLSAAVGVSVARNTIASNVIANIEDATIEATDSLVRAVNTSTIPETRADGFSGGLLAGIGNDSKSVIATQTTADISGATVRGQNVNVFSLGFNDAFSRGDGGAFGALGIGAMIARVELGTAQDDVVASLGDNTVID